MKLRVHFVNMRPGCHLTPAINQIFTVGRLCDLKEFLIKYVLYQLPGIFAHVAKHAYLFMNL